MRTCSFSNLLLAPALGVLASLCGCGAGGSGTTAPAAVERTAAAAPTAAIHAVYERSCKNCHAVPASGAPQTGDVTAWAPRIAQGADIVLDHTISGYKRMPPMGGCMDCSEDQYRALIEYMSGARLEKK